jgi:predicted NBD/HSP70 family sugar kinase
MLDLIRSAGATSRVEIAARMGLTEASVSRIVKQLVDAGTVVETGRGTSTGGKRPTLLQLNPAAGHAVGVFLSEQRTTIVLTDLAGAALATIERPGVTQRNTAALAEQAPQALQELLSTARIDESSLLGLGVATPGRASHPHADPRSGPPRAPDWDWAGIEADFARSTDLPVLVENDSTCAAIGEFWTTRGSAATDFAVVNMAIGIGFGLVIGGDVYRGATSNVGEIGHMIVDVDGAECACGNRGCLETVSGASAIVRRALESEELTSRHALTGDPTQVAEEYQRLARAAADGDTESLALIEEAARLLSTVLVSVTNLLDLERIVLTGPALDHVGEQVRAVVAEQLSQRAYIRRVHPTHVLLSTNRRLASAIGAATLVIHDQLGGFRRTPPPAAAVPAPPPATTSTGKDKVRHAPT